MKSSGYLSFKNRILTSSGVFFVLLLLTQYLAYQKFELNKENELEVTAREVYRITTNLTTLLSNSESATRTLAFVVEKYGDVGAFDSLAEVIISSNKYLDALQYTKDGVITGVYPMAGNEAALGLDVLEDSLAKKEALTALRTRKLFFAGPLQMRQGGFGLIGRLPIFVKNKFFGFAVVLIKFSTFLKAAGIDTTANSRFHYQFAKVDPNTKREVFFLPSSRSIAESRQSDIHLPAGDWTIHVSSKRQRNLYASVIWLSIAGFAFSLACGCLTYYLMSQPEKLKLQVDEQTKKIETSEKYFRALINNIADAIVLLDAKGNIRYQSQSSSRITGYTLKELQEQGVVGFIHPDDRKENLDVFECVVKEPGVTLRITYRFLHKNGQYVWLEGTFANLLKDEIIQGIVFNYHEITDRKQAEKEIARAYKEKEVALQRISDSVVAVDTEWRYTFLNDAALAEHPSGREATLGKIIWDVHPEMKENSLWGAYHEAMGTQQVSELESYYAPSSKWFHLKVYPSPEGLTVFYADVTKRKNAEALVLQNERRFRALIENSTDGLTVVNRDGMVVEVSSSGRKILGYDASELLGMLRPDLIHSNDRDAVMNAFSEIKDDPTSIKVVEYRHKMPDGSDKWLECTFHNLVKEPSINGIVLNYRDITDKKRIERELRQNALQLERSNKDLLEAQAVAKVGSWETDLNTLDVTWSLETYHIFELNPKNFKPKHTSFLEFVHPSDKVQVDAAFVASFNHREINTIEHRIVSGKGTEKWVLERWRVFNDETEKTVRAVGTCQDITERKVAEIEKALLIDNTEESFVLLDHNLKIVSFNYQFYTLYQKYFGLIIEKGKSILEYTPAERREIIHATYTNVLRGQIEESEMNVQERADPTKIFSLKYKPAKNDADEVIGVFVTCSDVTGRKKAEEQIYVEKYFSESVINSLPGIFYVYDKEGRFARWNKNFETISGYNDEEITRMHALDFYDTDEKEHIKKQIEKVFLGSKEEVVAHFYTKDKRKIPYYFNGHRISFNGNDYLIGIGIDITERARAEEELIAYTKEIKKLTAHLQQVREQERTRIAREIHDELGQQLTGLKMDVEWIAKKIHSNFAVTEKITEMISLIDQTVVTVRRIVSELRPGVLDDLGLIAALEWQCKEFERRTGIVCETDIKLEDFTFSKDLSINLFRIYQEALTNIVRHARASLVTTVLEEADDHLVLTIKDNGIGFDNRNATSGSSWGVVGMRERAAIFKGELKIDSKPHKGTVVSIRIPLKNITS